MGFATEPTELTNSRHPPSYRQASRGLVLESALVSRVVALGLSGGVVIRLLGTVLVVVRRCWRCSESERALGLGGLPDIVVRRWLSVAFSVWFGRWSWLWVRCLSLCHLRLLVSGLCLCLCA